MFIGHFGLALAAKRAAPRVSLATLFGAAQFADLLWPLLVASGIEQVRIDPGNTASTPLDFVSYPYSHSLLMLIVWGLMFGWICWRRLPDKRTFGIIFALVVSHWVLDYVTHRPDMPLYPSGPKLGLGLWNYPAAEKAIEIAMYVAGLWIYVRATTARDAIGRWALSGIVAFLFIGFLASGTPPPSIPALWIAATLLGGLTILWAWWADRHREAGRVSKG
jgi:membrane-bound metal-dependent hydrolase YbcI (DUF457 family)